RTAPSSLPRPVLQVPHNGRSDPLGRPTRVDPGIFFFGAQRHRGRYRVVIGQPHHHGTHGSVFAVLVGHRGKTIDRTHLTEDRTPWLGIGIRRTQALSINSVETDFEPTEGLPVPPVTTRPKLIQVSSFTRCRSFAQYFLNLLRREHFTRITGQCRLRQRIRHSRRTTMRQPGTTPLSTCRCRTYRFGHRRLRRRRRIPVHTLRTPSNGQHQTDTHHRAHAPHQT